MAKTAGTAWGIDLGNSALKAIKVTLGEDDKVEVLDYAVIEHESILTSPEITPGQRTELIEKALEKFTEEHDLAGNAVVVGVPGHSSFARFAKLPPVEKKRIPDMVRYEAQQQIPFDINDVEWDWQVLSESDDAQEIEIGIFAIKSDIVKRALQPYSNSDIMIDTVQMGPMALFNFLTFDKSEVSDSKDAIILIDIGAENTDLIISNKGKVWQRSIKIGGNHFTAAVQKSFKLSFQKAEGIKRTANTSKYARQIFQAMRPVFSDLAAEIQRSLGFYSSGNRDTQFGEAYAMGNAIKLPGLLKFLQQSLSLPIKRMDNFDLATTSSEVSVAEFSGHIPSMSTAYGLALQGLDLGKMKGNLLPREIIRQTQWKRKHKWFIAACACMAIAAIGGLVKAMSAKGDINEAKFVINQISTSVSKVNQSAAVKSEAINNVEEIKKTIDEHKQIYEDRSLVQKLYKSLVDSLPSEVHNPDQANLYSAYNSGDRDAVMEMPRGDRKQVFISGVHIVYTDDLTQDFDTILSSGSASAAGSPAAAVAVDRGRGMMDRGGVGAMRGVPVARPGMPVVSRGGAGNAVGAGAAGGAAAADTKKAGFVLVLEGSTPHKNNLQYLNPPTAGIDRSNWGFFTRLYYLGKTDEEIKKILEEKNKSDIAIPSSEYQVAQSTESAALPFESFIGSQELKMYFDTDEGAQISGNRNTNQPSGIGIVKPSDKPTANAGLGMRDFRGGIGAGAGGGTNQQLPQLVDPFTQEVISTEYKEDLNKEIVLENGKPITVDHDYWFRVKLKIALKDSGEPAAN